MNRRGNGVVCLTLARMGEKKRKAARFDEAGHPKGIVNDKRRETEPKKMRDAVLKKLLCDMGQRGGAVACGKCALCAYGREWAERKGEK